MAKYLKKFELESEYEAYIGGSPILPNVSLCTENTEIYFNPTAPTPPVVPHSLGDIAYWDGSKLAYTPYTSWQSSLGTAIGVCFIPTSHAQVWGDGKARFISLKGVNSDGTASNTDVSMEWGIGGDIPQLTNYTKVPTWDNMISGATGSNNSGYLSSDLFTSGTQNVIDSGSKYENVSLGNMIPSPYAADGSFYEDYRRVIEGNNVLSDFNGKSNTAVLVGLEANYSAATACNKYSTLGTNAGDWYLPSCGELGYLMVRFKTINTALSKCGGVALDASYYYWSSSVHSNYCAYLLRTYGGSVYEEFKDSNYFVRPACVLS